MENQITQSQFTSLINSMSDGVIVTNELNNIQLYNAAALGLLNINTSIEQKPVDDVVILHDKNNKKKVLSKILESNKKHFENSDLRIYYDDESFIAVSVKIRPIYATYGSKKSGMVIILRDISHEKSLEEERNEFISVVSHELRTPITIAEGNISNAQLMINQKSRQLNIETALEKAHDQIIFLSELINDLATLSRAERGKLGLEISPINVVKLTEAVYKPYKKDAYDKGIELLKKIDSKIEILHSSELYLKEILQNLITNAIKYTERGSVTIGAIMKANGIQFYVQDTGIGIKQADQTKIFEKFFRSEDFHTKEHKGTGLGLYITQKLCTLISAKISVESEVGHGSTFTIYVPNLHLHKK